MTRIRQKAAQPRTFPAWKGSVVNRSVLLFPRACVLRWIPCSCLGPCETTDTQTAKQTQSYSQVAKS